METPVQLLTKAEASELLRISQRKLDYLVTDGAIRPTRIGSRVFFHPAEVARVQQPEPLNADA